MQLSLVTLQLEDMTKLEAEMGHGGGNLGHIRMNRMWST